MLTRPGSSARLAVITGLLLGCARGPIPPTADALVVDSAGVSIVTSRIPVWPKGGGWQVDSQPITVIGADELDPQQQWRWIEAAARFSDGNVVVGVEGSLRLFGPDGKFIRILSRSGDGPGEFQHVGGLVVLSGDSLRADDYMGRRVATYAPDGTLAREARLDMARFQALGRWTECQSGLLPDGSRFGCQPDATLAGSPTNRPNKMISEGWTSPGPGLLRQLHRIYVVTPSLAAAYPLSIDGGIEQFGIATSMGEVFVVHPFYSRSVIAAGGTPMRIAIATNPEYRIEVWSPLGKLERVIIRDGGRRAPTQTELADAKTSMVRDLERNGRPNQGDILKDVPTPDSLPAVIGLALTPQGEFLVQREGYLPSQATSLWDVYDPTGRWLGELRLPGHFRILSVGLDYLLAQRRTADDAWVVEVHRLTR